MVVGWQAAATIHRTQHVRIETWRDACASRLAGNLPKNMLKSPLRQMTSTAAGRRAGHETM